MGINAEMVVRVNKEHISPEMVLEKAYLLAKTFKLHNFWISKKTKRHALSIKECSVEGKVDVEVNWLERLYASSYPRGNGLLIINVARWLEVHFPTGDVLYGGDCDDEPFPFPESERVKLWQFFCLNTESYGSSFDRGNKSPVRCSWCPAKMETHTYHGLNGANTWFCRGCGETAYQTHDGQVTRFDTEEEYAKFMKSLRR